MPTFNLVVELTVDDLLDVVSKLDEAELAEFEIRFEQLWLSRLAVQRFRVALSAIDQHLRPKYETTQL